MSGEMQSRLSEPTNRKFCAGIAPPDWEGAVVTSPKDPLAPVSGVWAWLITTRSSDPRRLFAYQTRLAANPQTTTSTTLTPRTTRWGHVRRRRGRVPGEAGIEARLPVGVERVRPASR